MKKTLKYFALLFVGLAVVSCSDGDLVKGGSRPTYHSGDEIVFGASAAVPTGNESAKNSRTAYGNVSTDGKSIAINWVAEDQIDIACPQATAAQSATYKIVTPEADASKATNLARITPGAGLQWNGTGVHDFYGIYPSKAVFEDKTKYPETMIERPSFVLDCKAGKAIGHMPMNYTATVRSKVGNVWTVAPNMDYAFMVAKKSTNLSEVNAQGLSLQFMPLATCLEFDITANVFYNGEPTTDAKYAIQLDRVEFISVKGTKLSGDFEYNFNAAQEKELKNTSTDDRTNINLHLSYPGMKEPVKLVNNDVCKINVFLMPDKKIEAGDLKVRLWFTVDGKYQRQRTATLGKEIQFKHKYFFKNFKMPKVNADLQGSNWFSAVDDRAMMNQISMICAGNAFSSESKLPWSSREQIADYQTLWNNGIRAFEFVTQTSNPNGSNNTNANVEEGLTHEHFVCGEFEWDGRPGVYATKPSGTEGVKTHTFGEAFASLAQYLVEPEYSAFKDECLVIIARYHAANDSYDPTRYVQDLQKFLNTVSTTGVALPDGGKKIKVPAEKFVLLTANSTAVDLKGKIAIVVRPGDDAYCEYGQVATTQKAWDALSADWKNKICYIENWGSAYDRWDTRYKKMNFSTTAEGKTDTAYVDVAREGTWNKAIDQQTPNFDVNGYTAHPAYSEVEGALWGVSRSTTEFLLPWLNYNTKETLPLGFGEFNFAENFNFHTKVNGVTNGGLVQEWARVIPNDKSSVFQACGKLPKLSSEKEDLEVHYYLNKDDWQKGYAYLWYQWPTSYDQKLRAIKYVFEQSVARTGASTDPLCVNVLSGYFADKNHQNSFEPFELNYKATFPNGLAYNYSEKEKTFTPKNQGNGGNYAALAANLNIALYDYLTGKELKQGPWGLVQINYLGATAAQFAENAGPAGKSNLYGANAEEAATKTNNLMKLFIANNFSFPLKQGEAKQKQQNIEIGTTEDPVITE